MYYSKHAEQSIPPNHCNHQKKNRRGTKNERLKTTLAATNANCDHSKSPIRANKTTYDCYKFKPSRRSLTRRPTPFAASLSRVLEARKPLYAPPPTKPGTRLRAPKPPPSASPPPLRPRVRAHPHASGICDDGTSPNRTPRRTHQPKTKRRQSKSCQSKPNDRKSFFLYDRLNTHTLERTYHEMFQRRKLARNDVSRAVRIHLYRRVTRDSQNDVARDSAVRGDSALNGFRF